MEMRLRMLTAAALLALASVPAAGQDVLRRNAVVMAVDQAGPAVVNISTEQLVRNPFADSIFGRSFAELFQVPRGGFVENSLGSGTIVDPEGYILTNEHVLWGASRITVSLADGRKFPAEVVGTDSNSDLALIQIQSDSPLPHIPLGNSTDLMIGETVIAIGNPMGLSNTVTVGVLSALGREVRGGERVYADFIQTDAPINPGNSGGPLLNILGEFVGINTSIVADAEGIGFAIPVGRASIVFEELVHYGRVRDVWLGIDVQASGGGRAFDASTSHVMVIRSYVGGPADRVGIKPGDVIVSVDDAPVRTLAEWDTSIGSAKVGDPVKVIVGRDEDRVTVNVPAETFPFALAPDIVADLVGLEIADITPQMRRSAPLPERGVVVTGVRPGSPAARVGFRSADVIARINNNRVVSVKELSQAVPRMLERESVLFVVVRKNTAYYVTVDLS